LVCTSGNFAEGANGCRNGGLIRFELRRSVRSTEQKRLRFVIGERNFGVGVCKGHGRVDVVSVHFEDFEGLLLHRRWRVNRRRSRGRAINEEDELDKELGMCFVRIRLSRGLVVTRCRGTSGGFSVYLRKSEETLRFGAYEVGDREIGKFVVDVLSPEVRAEGARGQILHREGFKVLVEA
jgi:hypothetical protein